MNFSDLPKIAQHKPVQTRKIKTADLVGDNLDWAVSIAYGDKNYIAINLYGMAHTFRLDCFKDYARPAFMESTSPGFGEPLRFRPSTQWEHAGPIIDREQIPLQPVIGGTWDSEYVCWQGDDDSDTKTVHGSTALEAAMRAYVAAKLGEEVEVPE